MSKFKSLCEDCEAYQQVEWGNDSGQRDEYDCIIREENMKERYYERTQEVVYGCYATKKTIEKKLKKIGWIEEEV